MKNKKVNDLTEKLENLKKVENNTNKKPIHVLLIEDNPGDARLIQEMIQDIGYNKFELICKENLTDGIQSLFENGFQVILLDLSLPDSYGLDTFTRMLDKAPETPIMILTGTDDQELAVEAVKSGAQDYLVKIMVNSTLLERSIYYAIERHRIKAKLKNSEKNYRDTLNRAEFFKDLFAHDMNNILQSILLGAQLCGFYLEKEKDISHMKEFLETISDNIIRGARLTTNVQKISELEKIKIILNHIDVLSILDRAIVAIKKDFQKRTINVHIDSLSKDVPIFADSYIQHAFENILINSVRHNENPVIEINIKISKEKREDHNFLKIEFIDNGIGIEDSRKKIIFQRGFTGDKSIFGMGLGLSLVSIIIERYKGEIWVEDRVKGDYSKGSNFIILIPEVLEK